MSYEIIENSIDFTNMVKTSLDLTILKDCYIDDNLRQYLTFPSLSINAADQAINYLSKFQEKGNYIQMNISELSILMTKDISKKKYGSILNNLIDVYDVKDKVEII